MDLQFRAQEENIVFYKGASSIDFQVEDNIVNISTDTQNVSFITSPECIYFEIIETDQIIFSYEDADTFIFNIEEIQTAGEGGGYNFIDIESPTNGINVGQQTSIAIVGTTMRCHGVDEAEPIVTINGDPVTVSPASMDNNIYEFTHTVDLVGGTNEIVIQSNNNSVFLSKTILVYRDESIDVTPPVTIHNITGNIKGEWYVEFPEVTLTATDTETGVVSTYYRYNGSWETYSGPFNIAEQGNVTLEYYSVDNNGNTEEIKSVSLKVDAYPPVSTAITTGSHYQNDWYNSEVSINISATDTSGVSETWISIDDAPYILGTSHTFTEDGFHTLDYYSVDTLGHIELEKTEYVNIDTTPVNILQITLDINEWWTGMGPVTYTIEVGEDTTNWSGSIDLSAFGKSSSFPLTPMGNTLIAQFTPAKQDATNSPSVIVYDRGGNYDTETAPQLITHEYRVNPYDFYFPAFSYVSNENPEADFSVMENVEAVWGVDYSREGSLSYGEDFTIVDNNKIQLTSKWQDDVESNSLGQLYVTAWED